MPAAPPPPTSSPAKPPAAPNTPPVPHSPTYVLYQSLTSSIKTLKGSDLPPTLLGGLLTRLGKGLEECLKLQNKVEGLERELEGEKEKREKVEAELDRVKGSTTLQDGGGPALEPTRVDEEEATKIDKRHLETIENLPTEFEKVLEAVKSLERELKVRLPKGSSKATLVARETTATATATANWETGGANGRGSSGPSQPMHTAQDPSERTRSSTREVSPELQRDRTANLGVERREEAEEEDVKPVIPKSPRRPAPPSVSIDVPTPPKPVIPRQPSFSTATPVIPLTVSTTASAQQPARANLPIPTGPKASRPPPPATLLPPTKKARIEPAPLPPPPTTTLASRLDAPSLPSTRSIPSPSARPEREVISLVDLDDDLDSFVGSTSSSVSVGTKEGGGGGNGKKQKQKKLPDGPLGGSAPSNSSAPALKVQDTVPPTLASRLSDSTTLKPGKKEEIRTASVTGGGRSLIDRMDGKNKSTGEALDGSRTSIEGRAAEGAEKRNGGLLARVQGSETGSGVSGKVERLRQVAEEARKRKAEELLGSGQNGGANVRKAEEQATQGSGNQSSVKASSAAPREPTSETMPQHSKTVSTDHQRASSGTQSVSSAAVPSQQLSFSLPSRPRPPPLSAVNLASSPLAYGPPLPPSFARATNPSTSSTPIAPSSTLPASTSAQPNQPQKQGLSKADLKARLKKERESLAASMRQVTQQPTAPPLPPSAPEPILPVPSPSIPPQIVGTSNARPSALTPQQAKFKARKSAIPSIPAPSVTSNTSSSSVGLGQPPPLPQPNLPPLQRPPSFSHPPIGQQLIPTAKNGLPPRPQLAPGLSAPAFVPASALTLSTVVQAAKPPASAPASARPRSPSPVSPEAVRRQLGLPPTATSTTLASSSQPVRPRIPSRQPEARGRSISRSPRSYSSMSFSRSPSPRRRRSPSRLPSFDFVFDFRDRQSGRRSFSPPPRRGSYRPRRSPSHDRPRSRRSNSRNRSRSPVDPPRRPRERNRSFEYDRGGRRGVSRSPPPQFRTRTSLPTNSTSTSGYRTGRPTRSPAPPRR